MCSVGNCSAAGCSYQLEPVITGRALLNTFTDAGVLRFPISTVSGAINTPFGPINYVVCGSGSTPTASPPECVLEANLGQGAFALVRDGGVLSGDGTVPMRVQRMPINISGAFPDNSTGFTGSATCLGANAGTVGPVPTLVRFSFRVDEVDGGLLTIAGVDPGGPMLKMATSFCSNSTFATFVQNDVSTILGDLVASVAEQGLRPALEASLSAQLCMRAGDGGVCLVGARADGGLCVNPAGRCYSGLHFRPAIPTIPACLQ